MHFAVQAIRSGDCNAALVGGCQLNHRFVPIIFDVVGIDADFCMLCDQALGLDRLTLRALCSLRTGSASPSMLLRTGKCIYIAYLVKFVSDPRSALDEVKVPWSLS